MVYGHWASSPVNALYVGNTFAGDHFSDLLSRQYPEALFISWQGKLVDWHKERSWGKLLDRADPAKCPYFTEGIYRVRSATSQKSTSAP